MALSATIANGASLSGAVMVPSGHIIDKIVFPSAWTTATVTFQVSMDGGATYQNVYDDLGEVAYQAAASRLVVLNHRLNGYVKIRSGTSGTPVVQGADRALVIYPIAM